MNALDLHELRDKINEKLPKWLQVVGIETLRDEGNEEDTTEVAIVSAAVMLTSNVMVNLGILDDFIGDPVELLANDLKRRMLRGMGVDELRAGLKEVLDWIESDRLNYAQEVALELLEAFEEGCLVEREEKP